MFLRILPSTEYPPLPPQPSCHRGGEESQPSPICPNFDRESRRRKKDHVSNLEVKLQALEAENLELKTQLKIGREAIAREEIEKNKFVEKISNLLKSNSSEAKIAELIKEFGDRYADYGKDRQAAVAYHLSQVERLLLPTQVTRMCLWSLQQPDSFYDDPEPLPAIDGQEVNPTHRTL